MAQVTGALGAILVVLVILNLLWRTLLPEVLHWRGVVVEGEVFDRSTRLVRYRRLYYLRYSYNYQGKTYAHNQAVDEDTYDIWGNGGRAEVQCLPMLPVIARLQV